MECVENLLVNCFTASFCKYVQGSCIMAVRNGFGEYY